MLILTVVLMSRLLALVVPEHTDPWWVEPVITSTVLALAVAAVLFWHRRSSGTVMMSNETTSRREISIGKPEELRELFSLTKPNGTRARCTLWPRLFGYEN